MRVVLQRVKHASVHVDGQETGSIGQGFLILLGVSDTDDESIADKMADKICKLRIFEDENGKTNRSLQDVDGEILVVSQFTLYAGLQKRANRPQALLTLERRIMRTASMNILWSGAGMHVEKVAHGEFGADMKVDLLNDGPFTLMLDSKDLLTK